jgi:hypothetical protein
MPVPAQYSLSLHLWAEGGGCMYAGKLVSAQMTSIFRCRTSAASLVRGILAYGFARAYCDECGHDFLVTFSCKGRGYAEYEYAASRIVKHRDLQELPALSSRRLSRALCIFFSHGARRSTCREAGICPVATGVPSPSQGRQSSASRQRAGSLPWFEYSHGRAIRRPCECHRSPARP